MTASSQGVLFLNLTTPALLFPAISLLFLAYTNRFMVLAQLIRQLHRNREREETTALVLRQIDNLKHRIVLVKWMQAFGVLAFLACAASMFLLFAELEGWGRLLFGGSLIALVISLLLSLYEILISTTAITIEIEDLERRNPRS